MSNAATSPADPATPVPDAPFLHDVFISYSRRDIAFARCLERALRAWRPPRGLAVAQRPLRVFRDETDFSGTDYDSAVARHLRASASLLLLCSPHSRASAFVGDEIARFAATRGADRIVPVLVDGIPNNEARTPADDARRAFHDALLHLLHLPLASDFRNFDVRKDRVERGRFEQAWYKVLADLHGLERAAVEDREARRRTRQRRMWGLAVGVAFAILATLTGWALIERTRAIDNERVAIDAGRQEAEQRRIADENRLEAERNADEAKRQETLAIEQQRIAEEEAARARRAEAEARAELRRNAAHRLAAEGQAMVLGIRPDGTWRGFMQLLVGQRATRSPTIEGQVLDALAGANRLRKLQDTGSPVLSMTPSPDGRHVATGGTDGVVRFWDATTLEPRGSPIVGHGGAVAGIVFTADGRVIVGTRAKTMHVWDRATGRPTEPPVSLGSALNALVGNAGGSRLAAGLDDASVLLWDVATGEPVGERVRGSEGGHPDSVEALAFSPDGRRLLSAGIDPIARMWDAVAGGRLPVELKGHESPVQSLAFAPDGRRVVSASYDGSFRVFDAASGAPVLGPVTAHAKERFGLSTGIGRRIDVAFSPDGQRLVSVGRDATVRLWNMKDATPAEPPLEGHTGEITAAAFLPDGRHFLTAGADGSLRLWDAAPARDSLGGAVDGRHGDYVTALAVSPDGRTIASGSPDTTIRLWHARDGSAITMTQNGVRNHVNGIAFSPDRRRLASANQDGTVTLRDAASLEPIGQPLATGHGAVRAIAFSAAGDRMVTTGTDAVVRVWNANDLTLRARLDGTDKHPLGLAISRDGRRVVVSYLDGRLEIWNLPEDPRRRATARIVNAHSDAVRDVAFSPDGRLIASAGDDRVLRLWEAATGRAVGEPFRGHAGNVNALAFSPDGQWIASGSDDETLRLWDVATGSPIGQPLRGHSFVVVSVAFHPDGQSVVSGGADRTVRIWPVGARAARRLCDKVSRVPSRAEWNAWVGTAFEFDPSLLPCTDAYLASTIR